MISKKFRAAMQIATIFTALTSLIPCTAAAADIRALTAATILIEGKIVPGDAVRLAAALTADVRQRKVYLNSMGGDLSEAIRMGEVIRTLRTATFVKPGMKCASACFFVWLNGSARSAIGGDSAATMGNVGLHRPYLSSPANTDASLAAQTKAVLLASAYLESKQISRKLIDIMMSKASSRVHWLSGAELDELGSTPPDLEELYIAKCLSSVQAWTDRFVLAKKNNNDREAALAKAGVEAQINCQADLNLSVIYMETEKFRLGWMPPFPAVLTR